ncbi:MAG: glycosyltransferase family 4 protein [Candidatus Baldrarchaeia archaeon]
MVRIFQIFLRFWRAGGVERWITCVTDALRRRGLEAYVITMVPGALYLADRDRIPLKVAETKSYDFNDVDGIIRAGRAISEAISEGIDEDDIILIHSYKELVAGVLLKKRYGCKLAYMLHNPPYGFLCSDTGYRQNWVNYRLSVEKYRLWREFIGYVDIFFTNTRWVANLYKEYEGISAFPIYGGSEHLLSANSASIECDDPYILCVGAFEPRKRQHMLLRVLSRLDDVNLALVGFIRGLRSKRYFDLLKKQIDVLGLRERVYIRLNCSDEELVSYYRGCDFLVHPAYYEHMGLTPMEALSFGKPVIAQSNGGIPEILRNGVDSALFSDDNEGELARLIRSFWEDSTTLKEMSRRAFDIRRRFNWERTADLMLRGISNALGIDL